MSREMEIDRRARLRSALVKAGREERASDSLRATLLAVAAATAATAPGAVAAAASSSTVAVSSAAGAASAVSNVTPGASSTAAVAASAKGTVAWKILAVLLAIGAAGTGAAFYATNEETPEAAVPATAVTTATPVGAPPRATTPPPAEIASVSVDDLPTVKESPSSRVAPRAPSIEPAAPAATPAAPAATPSPAARLTDETKTLGAIRASLHKNDTREALRLLDSYETEFPRGVLAEEAEVLRIETLVRAGDKEEAARRASRFLAERPSSPHAARVRTMTRRLSEPE